MPEKRLAKARETLPREFQFGDGRVSMADWPEYRDRRFAEAVALRHRQAREWVIAEYPALFGRSYAVHAGWNTIEPE